MSTMSTIQSRPAETRSPQVDEGWSASLALTSSENRHTPSLPVFKFRQGTHGMMQRGIDEKLPPPVDTTVRKFVAMWLSPPLRTVRAQWRNANNEGRALANSFLAQSVSYLSALPEGFTSVEIASLPSAVSPSLAAGPGRPGQPQTMPQVHQLDHAHQARHWAA